MILVEDCDQFNEGIREGKSERQAEGVNSLFYEECFYICGGAYNLSSKWMFLILERVL